ncbi:MAG TPA: DUF397 domain-containing protein [Pseudonocardiaceae bacterium]|nr:DUF397 domain-containing protein [Pseudonocardiaceae bacterium]
MSTVDLAGARWRRSSYSSGSGGGNSDCVEVAFGGEAAAIRDSKNVAGPVLAVPASSWTALLRACR